jgi:hypothetical protein
VISHFRYDIQAVLQYTRRPVAASRGLVAVPLSELSELLGLHYQPPDTTETHHEARTPAIIRD